MLYDRQYMREATYHRRWALSTILVLANVAVFALELLARLSPDGALNLVMGYLPLYPADLARGWVWQLLTFQFLHAGPFHLLINCAMLYMFGRSLEQSLGPRRFLTLYFASGVCGGLLQAICSWSFPRHFGAGATVGASAGVFGLIAAFAFLNRETRITTLLAFIIPISMRAKYLLIVETVIAVLGMLERQSGIAHAAHLGGMLAALAFLVADRYWYRLSLPRRGPRFAAPPEPELVAASRVRARQEDPSTAAGNTPAPPADFISREVDPILEKISAHGIQSLTERERRILEQARARMTRR
ncbi:MAG TPA: rhomboid family intramembrane serine protease [Verrucomicrobiota bacterium]|nr:rhomboid family intramembrane serine protease [Verrucomicrobiota bacterium]HNU53010.1 rhomboid family intramembrane serine protease [Verrucomicrobiota bacterium]